MSPYSFIFGVKIEVTVLDPWAVDGLSANPAFLGFWKRVLKLNEWLRSRWGEWSIPEHPGLEVEE